MSELGETFRALREHGREKRLANGQTSREVLRQHGVKFRELSDTHLRVGDFDFWPSTGLFINIRTRMKGRGVFNLIRMVIRS